MERVTLQPSRLRRLQHWLLSRPFMASALGYPVPVLAETTAAPPATVGADSLMNHAMPPPASHVRVVVRDLCASLQLGSLVGVLGASGSGKTTLLNSLAGTLPADDASVSGQGLHWVRAEADKTAEEQADDDNEDECASVRPPLTVHYVAHEEPYESVLTVRESVRLAALCTPFLQLHGHLSVDEWCHYLLSSLRLLPVAEERLGALTASQRLLVQIAAALAMSPRVLLLDEPCSVLSTATGRQLLCGLRALCRQLSVCCVLTLHQPPPSLLASLDQVLVVRKGRKAFDGSVEEFLQRHEADSERKPQLGSKEPVKGAHGRQACEHRRIDLSPAASHSVSFNPVAVASSPRRLAAVCESLLRVYTRSSPLFSSKLLVILLSAIFLGLRYARLETRTGSVREFLSAINYSPSSQTGVQLGRKNEEGVGA
jgi:ABC-type multidrug transport system ATPase subunit